MGGRRAEEEDEPNQSAGTINLVTTNPSLSGYSPVKYSDTFNSVVKSLCSPPAVVAIKC